jgi:hypothetical protein
MKTSLSEKQAYKAMLVFLENYYQSTKSDEVAGMLGAMTLGEDGEPMDAAYWEEWIRAVKSITHDK